MTVPGAVALVAIPSDAPTDLFVADRAGRVWSWGAQGDGSDARVVHDLTAALTLFGFLDEKPPSELVALRRPLFEEAANPHHYRERRRIADMVPDETLHLSPSAIAASRQRGWRKPLGV